MNDTTPLSALMCGWALVEGVCVSYHRKHRPKPGFQQFCSCLRICRFRQKDLHPVGIENCLHQYCRCLFHEDLLSKNGAMLLPLRSGKAAVGGRV